MNDDEEDAALRHMFKATRPLVLKLAEVVERGAERRLWPQHIACPGGLILAAGYAVATGLPKEGYLAMAEAIFDRAVESDALTRNLGAAVDNIVNKATVEQILQDREGGKREG